MHDQAVAEIAAFFRGNDFPEGHLDFLRLLDAVHETHAVGQADAVGVCDNGRLAKNITHDEVGAFSSHTGQF